MSPPAPDPSYPEADPPPTLYHALAPADAALASQHGLAPTTRPHVHLARLPEHARAAVRAGADGAVVLAVDAAAMRAAGHAFFASPKGTWLCHGVPPEFVRRHD